MFDSPHSMPQLIFPLVIVLIMFSVGGCAHLGFERPQEPILSNQSNRYTRGAMRIVRPRPKVKPVLPGQKEEEETYPPKMVLRDTPEVRALLSVYVSTQRRHTMEVLRRRRGFLRMIEEVLIDFDLPLELANVPFVESEYRPRAVSSAGARGLWQFMKQTARHLGLRVGIFHDDRDDPYLSTVAAARYLSSLYDRFDDWFLALAAYNCGPARIAAAISEGKTRDFFVLAKQGNVPRETSRFISKFVAATLLTRNLDIYGLEEGTELKVNNSSEQEQR